MGKAIVIKYESKGEHFEILVDPDAALDMKLGKPVSIDKVLISDTIYKDSRRGLRASESSLKKVFGTTDSRRVAELMIRNGEVPLTAEQRKKLLDEKRRQIVEWISRNCIDTRTRAPVPPQRVELAMQQADVTIDPFKPVEEQVNDVIKSLQRSLPIKVAVAVFELKVPAEYAQKVKSHVMHMGRVVKETYDSEGNLLLELEAPAGMQDSILSKANEITHGNSEIRLISITK
ncbi:MAG: ribosome assembly factor SBDS [Thermocladium sp.]|jgi:ribosome maturation protein SDO1|nr:MAG: RNA-associated protein [Thermocladium sp. ECH_B]